MEVLVVGDINRVFSDAKAVEKLPFEVCATIGEALTAASANNFKTIGVEFGGLSGKFKVALKALREVNNSARIILLVRMGEEAAAINLVRSVNGGGSLADDYLICPVGAENFYQSIAAAEKWAGGGVADPATEAKIKQLEKLATEDELTGLKNRRYIWEFARQIMDYAGPENGRVTLLIFDIDDFKHYNDVYGHPAGDEILKQAAMLMQRCCRQHDVVGRIGGDEFAVVFWDEPKPRAGDDEGERRSAEVEPPKEPVFVSERFMRELKKEEFPSLGAEGRGVLAISGGLASFPRDGLTIEELFKKADEVLLDAKRSGKNRIYLVGKSENNISTTS